MGLAPFTLSVWVWPSDCRLSKNHHLALFSQPNPPPFSSSKLSHSRACAHTMSRAPRLGWLFFFLLFHSRIRASGGAFPDMDDQLECHPCGFRHHRVVPTLHTHYRNGITCHFHFCACHFSPYLCPQRGQAHCLFLPQGPAHRVWP